MTDTPTDRARRLFPRRPGHCIICNHPLPPLTKFQRVTGWLLAPPPTCRDVDACMARFRVRVGVSHD